MEMKKRLRNKHQAGMHSKEDSKICLNLLNLIKTKLMIMMSLMIDCLIYRTSINEYIYY